MLQAMASAGERQWRLSIPSSMPSRIARSARCAATRSPKARCAWAPPSPPKASTTPSALGNRLLYHVSRMSRPTLRRALVPYLMKRMKHHPACYLTTDGNAAAVALDVDANNLEGFPTLKASDQAALKALTARADDKETPDGEPSESRSTKIMKDSVGSALAVSGSEGTSQIHTESPDRKRKVSPGIASKLNQEEKEQVLRYDPKLWETTLNAFSPSLLANVYKGAKLPHGWLAFSSVIFYEAKGLQPSEKIAAFDFDGCLANTDVRRSGADAWKLMYPSIPKKLEEYLKDGYKLVIFSNESNIERWKNSRQKAIDSKCGRVESFLKTVKVPMQAFISCGKEGSGDACRKPSPGMWHILERHLNAGVSIDKERSFYVGDAAGRKSDHSAADIGFAQAADLKFYVPEKVFE